MVWTGNGMAVAKGVASLERGVKIVSRAVRVYQKKGSFVWKSVTAPRHTWWPWPRLWPRGTEDMGGKEGKERECHADLTLVAVSKNREK